MVLREMDVAYQCVKQLGRILPVSGDHQLPVGAGGSGSASQPLDNVRHAGITQGVVGWGMTFD